MRHSTRGHKYMLKTQQYNTKYRKNFFSLRITNEWNKLPSYIVTATNLNSFKKLVDKYFITNDIYFNHKYSPEVEQ